jgi:hypothetical protein
MRRRILFGLGPFLGLILATQIAALEPAPIAPALGSRREENADPPWAVHGRLRVSDDGRFLQHADGTPFFWLGDTAWALHQNLSREDVQRYLDDAATARFNVVQLMSVNAWALDDWRNFYGATPYRDNSAVNLNPPYWRHLGWVIDQAAARRLFTLLVYGSPGRIDNHGAVTRTPAEAYAYGNALGTLYRDKPNLIWSGGIDVNPDDPKRVSPMGMEGWNAMAEGVADGVNGVQAFDGRADWTSTLMTYHPRGSSTSSTWFHKAPWLDFNGAQVGWRGDVLLRTISSDHARKPAKPIINIEPWYERCTWKKPPVDDWEVRLQAYQSVFAGACGHTYGHHDIWPLDSPGLEYGKRWREALGAPGRMQMRFLRQLMESEPIPGRVPLPKLVTAPNGKTDTSPRVNERIAATGASDGSWAFVYSPRGASFVVQLTEVNGPQVSAHWFDPRTGTQRPITGLKGKTRHAFDPPGEPGPGNDWVLVLTSLRPATRTPQP